jgi:HSP20 family protein
MITLFKDPIFSTFDKVINESVERINTFKQTNIERNEDEYRLQIAVPGLTKKNIKLSIKENTLFISYEKSEKESTIFTNSFNKTYNVPDDVDEKNITGSVENGVLEVILPKSKKRAIERLISIN